MLFKILSLLAAAGFSTIECAPYPEPKASSVTFGRVLRSSVEAAPITYQQSTLPAAYVYSAIPSSPLAATNPYQTFAYTTSPYYSSQIATAFPAFSYSLPPSSYTRSVTQQFVPAAAAPPATPDVAPAQYSYPAVYSNSYAPISAAGRSVQGVTQAIAHPGQYLG